MWSIKNRFIADWFYYILIPSCLLITLASGHNYPKPQALFPDLVPWAGELTEGQCARDSKLLRESAANGTLWAARMVDSCGQARVALEGKQHHPGSFEGCLSAGVTSPLRGARYCAVEVTTRPQPGAGGAEVQRWSHVDDLPPDSDVRLALAGSGQAEGFWQLGFVNVAVCVPMSCSRAQVEAGLRAELRANTAHALQVSIRIPPTAKVLHRHGRAAGRHANVRQALLERISHPNIGIHCCSISRLASLGLEAAPARSGRPFTGGNGGTVRPALHCHRCAGRRASRAGHERFTRLLQPAHPGVHLQFPQVGAIPPGSPARLHFLLHVWNSVPCCCLQNTE